MTATLISTSYFNARVWFPNQFFSFNCASGIRVEWNKIWQCHSSNHRAVRPLTLGTLDMGNFLPDLRMKQGAEVVTELAFQIIEPLVELVGGGNLDAGVFF